MDFDWTAEDDAYRSDVKAFLAEHLPPDWNGYDHSDLEAYERESKRFCRAMAERGWLTQNWPAEYGGQDASPWRAAVLSEELWPIGEPRGPQYMNANWIGPAIMRYGNEEQKRLHLPRISAGDVCWCQGFSEPDAGSDLASLRTKAIRDGDDYVVTGSKIWTSHVGLAEYCFLLVRTDPEQRRGAGISCLLTPMDTPGLEISNIPGFVGEQSFHQLVFDEARIPVANRLGAEHGGWEVVRWALAFERVGAAHHRSADLQLERHAAFARQAGLMDDPEIQSLFGEAWGLIEVARLLFYRVVDLRAHGSGPTADSNMSRIAGTAAHKAVAEIGQRLYGEESLVSGSPADPRRTMAFSVAAGATEIQLDQVAIGYLGLPRIK
jgi:alkylation response protein AidB-like acyl-CoA dehydrogenase